MVQEHEQLLTELVGIRSYSGEEERIRTFIQDWFRERKIDSFVQDGNLVVHFEGKDQSRAFIFNSHMDTVIAGQEWGSDPLILRRDGERAVGLGVSDMKSGLAASMLYAEKVNKGGLPPVDLWFTYVAKEEEDGSGSKSLVDWFSSAEASNYKDAAAIFTEPNSLSEVEHGHRGNYFVIAESRGPSGHASRPGEVAGDLAVPKMFSFAERFQKSVEKWNAESPSKYFNPAITVGVLTSIFANAAVKMVAGENGAERPIIIPGSVNKFPETCVATFDLRTTPEFHGEAWAKVEALAKEMGVSVKQLYDPAPAGFTDPSEKIVRIASTLGEKRVLTVSQASADLGFFTAKGIKAVILGPGEKEQCHMANEYCYPAQIPPAVNLYSQIVEAWAK